MKKFQAIVFVGCVSILSQSSYALGKLNGMNFPLIKSPVTMDQLFKPVSNQKSLVSNGPKMQITVDDSMPIIQFMDVGVYPADCSTQLGVTSSQNGGTYHLGAAGAGTYNLYMDPTALQYLLYQAGYTDPTTYCIYLLFGDNFLGTGSFNYSVNPGSTCPSFQVSCDGTVDGQCTYSGGFVSVNYTDDPGVTCLFP